MSDQKTKTASRESESEPRDDQFKMELPFLLPNLFTLANALCGLIAMGESLKALHTSSVYHLRAASWFILLGIVLDSLDGFVARYSGGSSFLGIELDSLSDAVSFGVAPALLVYITALQLRWFGTSSTVLETLAFPIVSIYVFCVLVRLARFNVKKTENVDGHGNFAGLPSPAAAALIAAGFLLILELTPNSEGTKFLHQMLSQWEPLQVVFQVSLGVVFLLALFMVSSFQYTHVESVLLDGSKSFLFSLGVLAIACGMFFGIEILLFSLVTFYILSGFFCKFLSPGSVAREGA